MISVIFYFFFLEEGKLEPVFQTKFYKTLNIQEETEV